MAQADAGQVCLLLVKLKRFVEAEAQLVRVLEAEQAMYGLNSLNIVDTYKLLAMVYKVNGKRSDLIRIYETIRQSYARHHGINDKRTLAASVQLEGMLQAASPVASPKSKQQTGGEEWEEFVEEESGDTYSLDLLTS